MKQKRNDYLISNQERIEYLNRLLFEINTINPDFLKGIDVAAGFQIVFDLQL